MRTCTKCHIEKAENEFYAHGGNTCKKCASEDQKIRYYANRQHILERNKKYRREIGRDILNERQQKWRLRNMDLCNEWAREYRIRLPRSYVVNHLRRRKLEETEENINSVRMEILQTRLKKLLEQIGEKICDSCGVAKPIDEFGKKKFVWKGIEKAQVNNFCKKCENKRNAAYKRNEKYNNIKKSSV